MPDDNMLTPLPGQGGPGGPVVPPPEDGTLPGAAAPRQRRSPLSGRAKAAIVVRLLLSEGADIPLEDLPEELQAVLTQTMGNMGLVDRDTLTEVVSEFAAALDGIGLSFPGGIEGALAMLDGRISPQTAARLRREVGKDAGDPWARLRALPAAELAEMAQAESTEVAAVLLSKLPTEKAAEMLGLLPGPDARRIAFAVSKTASITPQTVTQIGRALAAQLDSRPVPAFDDGPGERVGAILNLSPAATREDVLKALDEADAVFAGSVRKAIFTFAHIPRRISARDVPKLVRAVDQPTLVIALAGATGAEDAAAAEFLLSNIPGRMADALREEVTEKGSVKPQEAETAMNAVVAAIRQLEQDGEIELVPVDEED
ncbi:flagellar motor switch protein FliG [Jhaorihella thermophila]|uniref:Flagellar motor switch protein FliG n=1 Tax=Jhaorihella thermophila TaxID=488547 RepID=A0A1H5XXC6_9RHOB|nr:FliG C-terminal domain-containing protein [Jhaorihella thermophila]SEG15936.1 flagellar motor switch protein FliG [Jhaorihella thermophila]